MIRTPLYYEQFVWFQKCQKSYIPYLYNTDTSVKRTVGSVPLVSVLNKFDCTYKYDWVDLNVWSRRNKVEHYTKDVINAILTIAWLKEKESSHKSCKLKMVNSYSQPHKKWCVENWGEISLGLTEAWSLSALTVPLLAFKKKGESLFTFICTFVLQSNLGNTGQRSMYKGEILAKLDGSRLLVKFLTNHTKWF